MPATLSMEKVLSMNRLISGVRGDAPSGFDLLPTPSERGAVWDEMRDEMLARVGEERAARSRRTMGSDEGAM